MVKRKWLFIKVLFIHCVYFELFKTIELSSSLGSDFVGGQVTGYLINTGSRKAGRIWLLFYFREVSKIRNVFKQVLWRRRS